MGKVYALHCKNINDTMYHTLYLLSSSERQSLADIFRFKEDAIRSVCGEVLARYVCRKHLSIQDIVFSTNKYSKPFLIGYPDFHYNVSHSGDWVVCATSSNLVGVDVEYIDKNIDLSIAQHYFTAEEALDINTKNSNEKYNRFFHYLTAKESFIKCVGKGLSIPLTSFSIHENKVVHNNTVSLFRIKFYNRLIGYKLAVCSTDNLFPDEPHIISYEDLISLF